MGGHSHWANIKHKNGAADARRGKAWTKCSREISIAAKLCASGDPSSNPHLRKAMEDAKAVQMPSATIARAIKRGTGELNGAAFEEMAYEGYAPGVVALLIECTSENRNRTCGDIHTVMAESGGSLGAPNSVAWMFKAKGLITVKKDGAPSEDSVMELALATAEQSMIPDNLVTVSESDAAKVLKLMELLEGFDDVKNVYGILDIPDADERTRAFAFVHAGWGGGAGVAGVGVSFGAGKWSLCGPGAGVVRRVV